MTHFIDLLETRAPLGGAAPHHAAPLLIPALDALRAHLEEHDELRTESVWRLHRATAAALSLRGAPRPPGGWRAFCSLLAGTGFLSTRDDAFLPGPELHCPWTRDEVAASRHLLESFTRFLIPPAAAASLFLSMGVHPLWGLRLARRRHDDAAFLPAMEGWKDESLFGDEGLSELRKAVFAALSLLVASLRRLDAEHRYSLDALTGLIAQALRYGARQIEDPGGPVPIVIQDLQHGVAARTLELAARELLDSVLIPAGLLRRLDDDTFLLFASSLEELQVGHLGADAQRTWLQCFLVDDGPFLVA